MKNKVLIAIAAFIFLIGIIGSLFALLAPKENTVRVISDGKVLYTFDLNIAQDQTFTVPFHGSSNTVEIKDGKIRVKSAQCPDQTCVHSGWLHSSAMPIVCLPNRLVIEFTAGSDEIDAMAE